MRWMGGVCGRLLSACVCVAGFILPGCSLFHQDLPNEAPVLQLREADTTRTGRGGRVELEVRASDADDDPLFYTWSSLGVGSFTDSTSPVTVWIAPAEILSNSEFVLIRVTIVDRQCDLIPSAEDRETCQSEALKIVESFLIEVVQRPPTLELSVGDTTISFASGALTIDAIGSDEDGDPLTFEWQVLEGRDADLSTELVGAGHSRTEFLPLYPENHRLSVETSDGSATVKREVALIVDAAETPEGGMVTVEVELADGTIGTYEIDAYEYPNMKGSTPLLVADWFEAARLCADQGKRLCRSVEWRNACQGPEGSIYSSSEDPLLLPESFGRRFCNTVGSEVAGDEPEGDDLAPSGSFPNCASSTGVYDLTGNALEWLESRDVFGDRVAGQALSSVEFPLPCRTIVHQDTIRFSDDFDIFNQAQVDSLLDLIPYQGYATEGFGFRCCR